MVNIWRPILLPPTLHVWSCALAGSINASLIQGMKTTLTCVHLHTNELYGLVSYLDGHLCPLSTKLCIILLIRIFMEHWRQSFEFLPTVSIECFVVGLIGWHYVDKSRLALDFEIHRHLTPKTSQPCCRGVPSQYLRTVNLFICISQHRVKTFSLSPPLLINFLPCPYLLRVPINSAHRELRFSLKPNNFWSKDIGSINTAIKFIQSFWHFWSMRTRISNQ